MRFGILGPLLVVDDQGREVALRLKQRAVLAILLLRAGEVVSSERLVDELWGERTPATAQKTVQVYISHLRKALGDDILVTRAGGYALQTERVETDVDQFRTLAAEGHRALTAGDARGAAERLREALAFWRGPPLADFVYEPFAQSDLARLEDERLAALEDRIDADLALGAHATLVGELEALTRRHPLRERLCAELMLALYRSGRQAEALDVYRRVRAHLSDEFGLEPGSELKTLQMQILEHAASLAPDAADSGAPVPAAGGMPPRPPTPLIGRGEDVARVCGLVESSDGCVVTLVGPGGVGKTRLALDVVRALESSFPDGVCWVELAGVGRPEDVESAVSRALGVTLAPGESPREALLRFLVRRRLLLVIDNFEHVLDAAGLVSELHAACHGVALLVTSREALNLSAEQLVVVAPLPVPVAAGFRTFLISDIRGYSSFAAEYGDEAGAVLTGRFIELAGDVVSQFDGDGIGTVGDAVLFAFESPCQAIRAAVALQRALQDATRQDPSMPMPAGIGLDVGEAVLVRDGWRANAINVAARLGSIAKGGEILATREVAHLAQAIEGIRYLPRPAVRLKGIAEPVTPVRVVGEAGDAARPFAELGFTHAAVVPVHRRFRIVVADDHYLVREGVRRLLETDPEIEVVAVYADLDSLLEGVAAELPDVVLTDIRMPPTGLDEGIQAARRLRETHPDVGVVVLSQYAEPGYALALLEEGTARRGYLLKERIDDLAQLVAAIQQVAAGGSVIDPKVVESLVTRKARLDASPLNELTAREREVLREMAEGKNNAAIARGLFLAERSVENVIHSIFVKLGIGFEPSVHKRVKAVILYLAEGG